LPAGLHSMPMWQVSGSGQPPMAAGRCSVGRRNSRIPGPIQPADLAVRELRTGAEVVLPTREFRMPRTKVSERNDVLVGTSGWSYRSWRGPFFPGDMPAARHLEYYATRFATTELNGVFYRTPTEEAVKAWHARTPDDFVFAWKASKFITHWKRLGDTSINSLELLESRLKLLGRKAGPILFQLPPQFAKNRERLASFLTLLNPKRHYAFEFRHPSWYEDEILDLLRDNDMALCISDHHDAPSPWIVTAKHVYIRGHGPGGHYRDHYSGQRLGRWARDIKKWQRRHKPIYVYFDNDKKSAAPVDAARLVHKFG
jgi:uncharacterized protein YecE (DUF72 family)